MLAINTFIPTLLLSCFLLTGTLQAATSTPSMNDMQSTTPPPPRNENTDQRAAGKPPADAIAMCLGKDERTACTMNGPQGEVQGFCEYTPDKLYFACNPQRGPQRDPLSKAEYSQRHHQIGQNTAGLPSSKVTTFPIDR